MKPGDHVPDFELPDQDGTPRRLSHLLSEGRVVLFFYPAAMTAGCTKESCHFRDLVGELKAAGARPVGISMDPIAKQKQFAEANGLTYPLLSDAAGEVAKIFGVKRLGPLPVKRKTFVIDTDARVMEVIGSELAMDKHADDALAVLAAAG